MLGIQTATRQQSRRTRAVLENKALGVLTGLNIFQALTHGVLSVFGHDTRAGDIFAVLCIVRDRVVHVGDTAFVDQVNDQLEFMQALEVRHLGRIAGLYQSFVARLDQLNCAAAQHCLLAE